VEEMERSSTFYDDAASKPTTPSADSMITALPNPGPNLASTAGYFSRVPTPKRRSLGYFRPNHAAPPAQEEEEETEETSVSSASATWDQSRPPFSSQAKKADPRTQESTNSSKNSSTYSLEPGGGNDTGTMKLRQPSGGLGKKDAGGKYKFFDFVGGPGKKKGRDPRGGGGKDKGGGGKGEGERNEF
jgi:hypothetical protein